MLKLKYFEHIKQGKDKSLASFKEEFFSGGTESAWIVAYWHGLEDTIRNIDSSKWRRAIYMQPV